MKGSIRLLTMAVTFLAAALAIPAQAGEILLAGDSNIFNSTNTDNSLFFQNVFNGKSVVNYSGRSLSALGTSATENNLGTAATVTAGGLAGNDFMIFGWSRTSVSASELSAISTFASNGGALFLFGEGNTSFQNVNIAVNSILSAVGSTMSLSTTTNFDNAGFTTMSGANFIGTGPLTAGMSSWTTGFTASINIGLGSAIISGVADNGFGVAVAQEGAVSAVPEPSILLLLGFGLLGLGLSKRRKLS